MSQQMMDLTKRSGRIRKRNLPYYCPSPSQKPKSLREDILEIGIPGFDRFCNLDASWGKRLFWAILCFIVLIVCLVQCVERIVFYVDGYPAVRMVYEKQEYVMLPSITICPNNELALHPAVWWDMISTVPGAKDVTFVGQNAYNLMKEINMSVRMLWNISRLPLSNFTFSVSQGTSLSSGHRMTSKNLEATELPTTSGTCIMVKPTERIPHRGRMTYISFEGFGDEAKIDSSMRYRFLYHLDEDLPLVQYLMPFEGIHSQFRTTQYNILRMQKLIYLNTWRRPCDRNPRNVAICKVQCLQQEIFKRVKQRCSLPYMNITKTSFQECVTPDEFRDVYEETSSALNDRQEEQCGCPRKCEEKKYDLECISERNDTNSLFRLNFYIPENQVAIIEEINAYTFAALFADIGGTMGLFLGICVVQFFEIGEVFLKKLTCCRQKSRLSPNVNNWNYVPGGQKQERN